MTKLQIQNLDQTSAPKSRPNVSLKIWTKLQPQNLDQTTALKSQPVRRPWKICSDVAELGEVRASSAQGWRRSRTVSRPPIVACACLQDGDSSVAVAQSRHTMLETEQFL